MPLLSNPQSGAQGVTGLTADGYPWANADSIKIDQYGKILVWVQNKIGGTDVLQPLVSNDNGATWAVPTLSGFSSSDGEWFCFRHSSAFDSANDLLHVAWQGQAFSDGIFYRRYSFTRDGSNNITGMTRVAGISMILDGDASYQNQDPVAFWIPEGGSNGSILFCWTAANGEGRMSMRVLSNTSADGTAGNWVAPVSTDTPNTTNASTPSVAVSCPFAVTDGYLAQIMAMRHPTSKDLYLFEYGASATSILRWRRAQWNSGASNWSTGYAAATATISSVLIAGTDNGYGLKKTLASKPVYEPTSGKVFIAAPVWLSNAAGDTVSFWWINTNDTVSSRVDVYSAGGAHSYAPTLDIMADATSQNIVVSYLKSSDKYAYVQVFDASGSQVQAETLLFNTEVVDIPLLCGTRVNGKLLSTFRDATNSPSPPYQGYWATLDFEASNALNVVAYSTPQVTVQ